MNKSSWSGCYFLRKFPLSLLSLSLSVYVLLMLWHFLFPWSTPSRCRLLQKSDLGRTNYGGCSPGKLSAKG